jgi:hypothetical protein
LKGQDDFCKRQQAPRLKFTQLLELVIEFYASAAGQVSGFGGLEPKTGYGRRWLMATTRLAERGMTIHQTLMFSIGLSAVGVGGMESAMAQACTHDGPVVSCDDGRRGMLSGDAIIWPDGTRSSLSPHPSVIIGNKPSVHVGQGKDVVPLDDPNAPNKTRCALLDGMSYCY